MQTREKSRVEISTYKIQININFRISIPIVRVKSKVIKIIYSKRNKINNILSYERQ